MIRIVSEWWQGLFAGIRRFFDRSAITHTTPTYRVVVREDAWRVHSPAGWIKVPRDGRWKFDGDLERPTFSPSVVERWENPEGGRFCNHVVISQGRVRFLDDCTHEWAGRTADLIPLTPVEVAFYYERINEA